MYWVKENNKYHGEVLFWSFGWLPVVRSGRKSQEINLTPPRTSLSTPGAPIPTRKPQPIPKTIPKKLPRGIFYPLYFLNLLHFVWPLLGPKKIDPQGVDFFGSLFFGCFTSPLSCFRERAAPTGAAREPKLSRTPFKINQRTKQKQPDKIRNCFFLCFCFVCFFSGPL